MEEPQDLTFDASLLLCAMLILLVEIIRCNTGMGFCRSWLLIKARNQLTNKRHSFLYLCSLMGSELIRQ